MHLLLFLLLFIHATSSIPNFPIVHTSYGAVRGYEHRAENGFVGDIFKKIPYASPPIGTRRWRKPVPPEPWNYTLDGTFFGPACAQVPQFWSGVLNGFSEDCLTLNIYTSRECRESNAPCPVLHYIHGGSNLFGGSLMFTDEDLVTRYAARGIVLVTIGFRLGVFGVLALGNEDVLPSNLLVHDILESLRFVRKEIHNFGGDKNKISVMGHSSGGSIVFLLATSPEINKAGETSLFDRAIMLSGPVLYLEEEVMVNRSHLVTSKLGCPGSAQEIIDCLRRLSTKKILDVASEVGGSDGFSETHLTSVILSGELMTVRNVKELMEIPKQTKLMLGSLLNEFEWDGLEPSSQEEVERGYANKNNQIIGVQNNDECSQKYIRDFKSGKFDPGYNMDSQSVFLTSGMYARAQARAGREVYLYQLDYPEHTLHADDLLYVMGAHPRELDVNEMWLNRVYSLYFANFIKGIPPAPDWKPVHPELMNYYSINKSFSDDVSPAMKLCYNRNLMEYYDEMMEYDDTITEMKRQMLNSPVQYKNALIFPPERCNVISFLAFSMVVFVLSLVAFNTCRISRRSREGDKSLLKKIIC